MLPLLVLFPLITGLICLALTADKPRRLLLVCAGLAHLVLTLACLQTPPAEAWDGLLHLDVLGSLFLGVTSVLFLAVAIYGVGYLGVEVKGERKDFEAGTTFRNGPERVFTACLLFFLGFMTLVACTRHFGLLWVAVESTTLASAPLICFHRHKRSLEAAWKYLLICSVGIALALLGNIFLSLALTVVGWEGGSMNLPDLLRAAPAMQPAWLKAGFIFLLVGYGVKMGLAPMHNWLPDAHSESPSMVSALLSGALLNCAFLGILRVHQVCVAAGMASFSGDLLVLLGLVSMVLAGVFIVGQGDFKRLLAYSSVEHMGILALGVGIGGVGVFGAMLHAVNHSLLKAGLFLLAGNIMAAYHTKSCHDVHGVLRTLPVTGALWLALFLAITGSPPFGAFVSEFTILKALLDGSHYGAAVIYLGSLALIFVGMSVPVLRMAQGAAPVLPGSRKESPLTVGPSMALAAAGLTLGLFIPEGLSRLLSQAASALGN